MKKTMTSAVAAIMLGAIGSCIAPASAVVVPLGNEFTFQGRLDSGGGPYTGTADLQFRLYDGAGGGAALIAGPLAANAVTVTNGVFTVSLDFGAVFEGSERWLEIAVDTPAGGGVGPFTTLTPRQLLTSAPYALFAKSVNGANVTNLNANNLATGTVPNGRISGAYGSAVNFSNAGNTFTGAFNGSGAGLTNLSATNISAGTLPIARGGTGSGTAAGALSNLNAQARVTGTAAPGNYITAINVDGTVVTSPDANSGGDITAVNAGAGLSGGGASGSVTVNVATNGITNTMLASDALSLAKVSGGAASASGSNVDVAGNLFAGASDSVQLTNNALTTYGSDDLIQTRLYGSTWGELQLYDSTVGNTFTARLAAEERSFLTRTSGGAMTLWNELGGLGVRLSTPVATDSGSMFMYNSAGAATVNMEASNSGLYLSNPSNGAYMELLGNIGGETRLSLYNDLGNNSVFIDTDSSNNGRMILRNSAGSTRMLFQMEGGASPNASGNIYLYDAAGAISIELDGDFNGDGRVITDELQITGGSDLSEQFDIASATADLAPEPGMVVCIDPDQPGQLLVSARAYDRLVAGIMSGANGIKPGMLMGQRGSEADGRHPVALTGRVYVRCTDANGSIEPGDLLTSSDEPGKAMRVTDYAKAQGAIIGKAMTRMDDDSGMVLVLVGLQ